MYNCFLTSSSARMHVMQFVRLKLNVFIWTHILCACCTIHKLKRLVSHTKYNLFELTSIQPTCCIQEKSSDGRKMSTNFPCMRQVIVIFWRIQGKFTHLDYWHKPCIVIFCHYDGWYQIDYYRDMTSAMPEILLGINTRCYSVKFDGSAYCVTWLLSLWLWRKSPH